LMTKRFILQVIVVLVFGLAVGAVVRGQAPAPAGRGAAAPPPPDLKTLQADVERLKALVPSNSHIMMDVQWHWTNLWFAGQAKNWPLALYQFNEARGHIQWLIKKSPIIRSSGPDREDVDIEGIFGGVDTSSLADVKTAIDMKDGVKFAAAYRTMLESCYSCHKSVGRPYIKPMIPKAQAQSIMNMDPNADWPK
jgi:cytochrome c553